MKANYTHATTFLLRYRIWLIGALLILSICTIAWTKNHIGINTDTKDMLAESLDWRQLDQQHERLFPQDTDSILVVLESATPDQSIDAARALYQALQQHPKKKDLFKTIYYQEHLAYFRKSAFLFLNTEALDALSDRLAAIQPFLGGLIKDPSIIGLFQMLSDALDAQEAGEKVTLTPLLSEINASLEAALENKKHPVSWYSLISDKKNSSKKYRQFILLQPKLDYSELFTATTAINFIKAQAQQLQLEQKYQVALRLSGSVVLADQELRSVANANWIAILLSFLLISILLHIGFHSVRIVLCCLLTLICGLTLTTAFATATVGDLNLISIAFAILYIGLSIDFAIHYALCYQAQCAHNFTPADAVRRSSFIMARPLLLCTLTTAISFFAFIPTDYLGVAELGWIAGSGMFINFLLTFTLLPALLSYVQIKKSKKRNNIMTALWLFLQQLPRRYPKHIIWVSVIMIAVILVKLPDITFDTNTLNLQDQTNESVMVYRDLLSEHASTPWTINALAKEKAHAKALVSQLEQLDTVEKVVWLDSFIPTDQQQRLAIIEEIGLLLGDVSIDEQDTNNRQKEKQAMLTAFQKKIAQHTSLEPELERMQQNLTRVNNKIDANSATLTMLEAALLQSFPGRITSLADALEADYITTTDMPDALLSRWRNEQTYQLKIYPAQDISDAAALQNFVKTVAQVHRDIIGPPVINLAAGHAVSNAFQQAFLYALLAISLLLLLLMRSIKDTIMILFTLLTGALLTAGSMLFFDIAMNFANIIALPLLLGIGVDSSIHIVNRYRSAGKTTDNILTSTAARGVLISALTTVFSIGNLTFSAHQGTASMGLLLTTGIISVLACTLIILPALLTLTKQKAA